MRAGLFQLSVSDDPVGKQARFPVFTHDCRFDGP
jgi:hypothetical protein